MSSAIPKKKIWEEDDSSDSDVKAKDVVEEVPVAISSRDVERQLVVDSDIQNAEDLFSGLNIKDVAFKNALTNPNPKTEAEFNQFRIALVEKISKLGTQKNYASFVNSFVKDLVAPLTDTEAAKVQRSVGVIVTEKQKTARNTAKTKKGSKKAVVTTVSKGRVEIDDYTNGYDDFDDFM
ncbi:Eukaryotic translation initiation factor 3 subunit J [Smittium mucronatum]|uniref:Eukaryotic translation initiation factor 3 30 kDa subunit n=1 Tax=Smittium mucronatum TaxID=133383 RepID=A0A1R0H6Y0_9FUNG|nr:Eukaryotic translation initiation factor 3 subunit J [Smittium mucronatum]